MNLFQKFTIANISKRLNKINPKISLSHNNPFPGCNILSKYTFNKRFVKILPNGDIKGGMCRLIRFLIDFSFVRSLVADCYSVKGPPCYDPPSLFLIDLFRHIEGFKEMSYFLRVLRDDERGRWYRSYAGFTENIPSKGTFSNFRKRIGEKRYNHIFHVLVDIFHQLEIITFNILAHDGSLYPSWARYKGCTYFCDQCANITLDGVLDKVKKRILYRLNHRDENNLGSESIVKAECPSNRFPEDVKKPKIELFAFKLAYADGLITEEQRNTAILFGVKDELEKQQLCIQTIRSNIANINFDSDKITMFCPKIPKDTDAKIRVRRDPQNPSKKQKIFGYNIILSTSVEVHLKLELPVAVTNIAGNADEGDQIIANHRQIEKHHNCHINIDIADAKYDITKNYDFLRKKRSIPIIDYNRRRENLSPGVLKKEDSIKMDTPLHLADYSAAQTGLNKNINDFHFVASNNVSN